MNYSETRTYIDRQLVKLGWEVRLDKAGYKKIYDFTGGNEERLGQLYYKLVGMGSQQAKREVTEDTVNAAVADLKRMEQIVDKAKSEGRAGPKTRMEADRISIDELAKALESEVALEEKEARLAAEKFPAVDKAAGVAAPAAGAAAAPSSLPRILVVDDSPTIRIAVTKALKNDFSFVQAADGEAAWKLLKSDDSIQLVVTDLIMPKLDGYELIKRIRSDRTSQRIAEMPVIVVTTLEETNAKLRALVAGANDFVTKSTDAVELKMRVLARYQVAKSTRALEQGKAGTRKEDAITATRAPQGSAAVTPGGNGAAQRAAQTSSPVTPGAGGAARTSPASTQAGSGASAAPSARAVQPASGMVRHTVGASVARPNGGHADTAAQSTGARRVTSEVRPPISPAAIPKTASSLREVLAARGLSPLVNVVDAWSGVRGRLARANPLMVTTMGATALIVLIVGAIFVINRQHPIAPAPTTETPAPEALASSQDSPPASSLPVPAVDEAKTLPAAVDPTTTPGIQDTPNKTESRIEDQSAARKSEHRPAENAKSHTRTVAQVKTGKTQVGKQDAATRAPLVVDDAPKAEKAAADSSIKHSPAAVEAAAVVVSANANHTAAASSVSAGPAATTAAAPDAPTPSAMASATPAPAVPAPPSNVISQAELATLVKKFEFVYEAGDIDQFLTLFSDRVETNDTFTKADLRRDYEALFKTTEFRTMTLPNVNWDVHDNKADGWGNFEVKVRKVGAKEVNDYKGSLTFHVEKDKGRLYIKRLYHGQWRAGS